MSIDQLAECLALPRPRVAGVVDNVVTDSREARQGSLFVCLPGENVDGHEYAAAAVAAGAAAVLACRPVDAPGAPILQVENTEKALARLASVWRSRFAGKVIAITGTAGKTTVKDCLAAILGAAGKTAKTAKNHNNQIGLPLSILATAGDEKFWVLEVGISHAGDMDYLGDIVMPDLAVIINVGAGHTEGLGAHVAAHKATLLKYLAPGGKALVCADYPELAAECAKIPVRIDWFSPHGSAKFRLKSPGAALGEYVFDLAGENVAVQTPYLGEYGAENALAAAAAARLCGLDGGAIAAGFAEAEMPPQRFSLIQGAAWQIFDDTYNANPLSMRRMLAAASEYAASLNLPFAAVLGEMGELGAESAREHRQLGEFIGALRPCQVFWTGGHFADVRAGYEEKYPSGARMIHVASPDEFAKAWRRNPAAPQKGIIIFKGSRFNKMENFLAAFPDLKSKAGRDGNVL